MPTGLPPKNPQAATSSALMAAKQAPAEAQSGAETAGDTDWLGDGDNAPFTETLDADYGNVFQDDTETRRADAPELLSQWKSMPGGQGEILRKL